MDSLVDFLLCVAFSFFFFRLRDAVALAWLMEQGSSQQAIAEYGHAALSPEQQSTLTECINNLNRWEKALPCLLCECVSCLVSRSNDKVECRRWPFDAEITRQ